MFGYDNSYVKLQLSAVVVDAVLQHQISRCRRKELPGSSSKGNEQRTLIFLIMWQSAAVLILAHGPTLEQCDRRVKVE